MKQRLFTIAAGIVALIAGVLWVGQGAPEQEPMTLSAEGPAVTETGSSDADADLPSPTPTPSLSSQREQRLFSYAIATTELQGLAPDAAPGTRLDLWVATQPPITQRADVLPLIEGAILAEIVPPTVADGPFSAILQVPLRHARKLMWADMFGALSVLQVPTPAP